MDGFWMALFMHLKGCVSFTSGQVKICGKVAQMVIF